MDRYWRVALIVLALGDASGRSLAAEDAAAAASEGECPEPAAVRAELAKLLPIRFAPASFHIAYDGEAYRVQFMGNERRFVDEGRHCDERARTAAVSIAMLLERASRARAGDATSPPRLFLRRRHRFTGGISTGGGVVVFDRFQQFGQSRGERLIAGWISLRGGYLLTSQAALVVNLDTFFLLDYCGNEHCHMVLFGYAGAATVALQYFIGRSPVWLTVGGGAAWHSENTDAGGALAGGLGIDLVKDVNPIAALSIEIQASMTLMRYHAVQVFLTVGIGYHWY